MVGLTLTYSIMLTSVFQPFIEESAELENLVSFIVSVFSTECTIGMVEGDLK